MEKIRTKQTPNCPICNAGGLCLHEKLTDRLFGAPGYWNMKRCLNEKCQTVWVENTPLTSEIPKLYTSYFTHSDTTVTKRTTTFLDKIRSAHLAYVYGYKNPHDSFFFRAVSKLTYLHPAWKENLESTVFYLHRNDGGKLLEVGCGAGGTLESLTKKGWSTVGTDFDEGAVKNARSKGLTVYVGELGEQKFPEESFDAIVMSHVIEHIPNPEELLRECKRLLKKGGTLTLLTPNANARGFSYWGKNWFALDTPRHIQIFTPKSLAILAHKAGYTETRNFSTMHLAIHIWQMSSGMASNKNFTRNTKLSFKRKLLMQFVIFFLGWMNIFFPGKGEVAVLVCKK